MRHRSSSIPKFLFSIICVIVMIMWIYPNVLQDPKPVRLKPTSLRYELNIQNPFHFSNESGFKCIYAKLDAMQFPICIYNATDDFFVSRTFWYGGYFEERRVKNFLNFMERHDNFTFLDVGAKIGTHSLPIAHFGRDVIAVEPNWDKLRRLAKAVYLGRVSSKIRLLFHAISDNHSITTLKLDRPSRGNSEIIKNSTTCTVNCANSGYKVPVIILDDLVQIMRNRRAVIRVDTGGTGLLHIFTEHSASEFFRVIDVVLVQIEWVVYSKRFNKTPEKRALVDNFLRFFYERNYSAYYGDLNRRLESAWTEWPYEVCFKKNDFNATMFDM